MKSNLNGSQRQAIARSIDDARNAAHEIAQLLEFVQVGNDRARLRNTLNYLDSIVRNLSENFS